MARQIVWSKKANLQRNRILEYWADRNQSKSFSVKLNNLFTDALQILSEYPASGKITGRANVRVKIIHEYQIFYKVTNSEIVVLSIWDGRRNPQKLKIR